MYRNNKKRNGKDSSFFISVMMRSRRELKVVFDYLRCVYSKYCT